MTSYESIRIASQKLYNIAHNTPLLTSSTLNELTGFDVFIKAENFQRVGAFKFRGAYNAISKLSPEKRAKGVITHSSGNHAQAIALAGKLFQVKTVIVMPDNAPAVKVEATRGYGAEIVFSDFSVKAREETTDALIEKHGYTFIHPYNNDDVIEGQGTAAVEVIDSLGAIDAIITPVGGGGLLSGTSIVAKESKMIKFVFGSEPEQADDAYRSFKQKKLILEGNPNTIADGLRTYLSELTFSYISKNVDDIITVSEQEIKDTMKLLFERMKIVVEPSGAVPVAALIKLSKSTSKLQPNSKVVCIISGGNVDLTAFFKQF
jgi:threonine dehydratase